MIALGLGIAVDTGLGYYICGTVVKDLSTSFTTSKQLLSLSAPSSAPLRTSGMFGDDLAPSEAAASSPAMPSVELPSDSTSGKDVRSTGFRRTRPRGHSTSTIRGFEPLSAAPSLASTSSSMMSFGVPYATSMERVVSEPLSPSISSNRHGPGHVTFPTSPPSAASTVSSSTTSLYAMQRSTSDRGSSRGRTVSVGPDRSAGISSEGLGRGRSKSPFREFAFPWTPAGRKNQSSGQQTPSSAYSDTRSEKIDIAFESDQDEQRLGGHFHTASTSWWRSHSPRFWGDREKRKDTMSAEQLQSMMRIQEKVKEAIVPLLPSAETMHEVADWTGEVVHEVLALGADALEFAPVVGLSQAAAVLVRIWDAVQMVDINQLACLRLTERCANILISVRDEIEEVDKMVQRSPHSAHSTPPGMTSHHSSPRMSSQSLPDHKGKKVASTSPHNPSPLGARDDMETPKLRESQKELSLEGEHSLQANRKRLAHALATPMEKLISTFKNILSILEKQNRRPFIKRYLKREEIRQELLWCDTLLNDALSLFDVRILFRIYSQLLEAEEQRQVDNNALMNQLLHTSPTGIASPYPPPYQPPDDSNALALESVAPQSGTSSVSNILGLDLQSPDVSSQEHVTPPALPQKPSAEQMLSSINQYNARRNEEAFTRDAAYLRQLLSTALATNDDMEMIRILQVDREEMPEALKALQRALEVEVDEGARGDRPGGEPRQHPRHRGRRGWTQGSRGRGFRLQKPAAAKDV
ncbi:hypothetical protein NM688_g1411 [Phlebia brevispora]|uniref:Uncharacterized protein n=1 Tax=Phlebia brevispora TaxID=194682 RepID=A0ACC1TBR2_9APHY|nr:hypothetical protein NM688_g1411 [Phlebia brevispora]